MSIWQFALTACASMCGVLILLACVAVFGACVLAGRADRETPRPLMPAESEAAR